MRPEVPVAAIDMNDREPGGPGPAAPPDPGRLLCEVFIDALPVAGASISVVGDRGEHSIVGASDDVAVALEASQFALGVGPHWDALRSAQPAFLYDVAGEAEPGMLLPLVCEAVRLGASSLFAFPLRLGAGIVGVADLYSRTATDRWSAETVVRACDLAVGVAAPAVRLATRSADAERSRTGPKAVELRREVHQAIGMVMGQLDCDADTALLRLRARAFAAGRPLESIAQDVIRRRLDLSTS
jgi:hypothetical protein